MPKTYQRFISNKAELNNAISRVAETGKNYRSPVAEACLHGGGQ
jgi:hypothetical protein